jgi:hypothetical protein
MREEMSMGIIGVLMENWDSVLIVVAVAAGIAFLYRRGEITIVKNLLFILVLKAEKEFGSGTGALKRAIVIDWVYARLPKIARLFLPKSMIEGLLEAALAHAKRLLEENPRLCEYVTGEDSEESGESTDLK